MIARMSDGGGYVCWCSILDLGVFFQGCFFFLSVKVTSPGSCATKGG